MHTLALALEMLAVFGSGYFLGLCHREERKRSLEELRDVLAQLLTKSPQTEDKRTLTPQEHADQP